MKKILGLITILFIILAGIGFWYLSSKKTTVTINNHTFSVDVAQTQKEKEIGLSEKTSLNQGSGMIFPFATPSYYAFWMKNMKIPIDIVFIHDNRVVTIYSSIEPSKSENLNLPTYEPTEPADMVLEIPAGDANAFHLQKGDSVSIANLPSTK